MAFFFLLYLRAGNLSRFLSDTPHPPTPTVVGVGFLLLQCLCLPCDLFYLRLCRKCSFRPVILQDAWLSVKVFMWVQVLAAPPFSQMSYCCPFFSFLLSLNHSLSFCQLFSLKYFNLILFKAIYLLCGKWSYGQRTGSLIVDVL